jgi:hypothetical protein
MPDGIKDPSDLRADNPGRFVERLMQAIEASQLAYPSGQTPGAAKADWQPPIPLDETSAVEPFPVDVLPDAVRAFVEDVAGAKNCPADFVAVPLLVLAGAALGTRRAIEIKHGWWERPLLYAAIIGSPGSAKTPALGAAARPVYAEQARLSEIYKKLKAAWLEKDPEDRGPRPILERVYIGNVTVEAAADRVEENPLGLVMIRDELSALMAELNQYKGGKGSDRQFYLSMWAGEPVSVDRKNRDEPLLIPHPFLSIVGGIPPTLLTRLRGDRAIQDGFLDRFLFCYPAPVPAHGEDWRCLNEEVAGGWAEVLAYLRTLQPTTDVDGRQRPYYERLVGSGEEAWQDFTDWIAEQLNRDDTSDAIKGHVAKFKSYGARLALIIAFLRWACKEQGLKPVDGESMDRAARLVRYFYSHCLKVHAALESDPRVAEAKRVLACLARSPKLC